MFETITEEWILYKTSCLFPVPFKKLFFFWQMIDWYSLLLPSNQLQQLFESIVANYFFITLNLASKWKFVVNEPFNWHSFIKYLKDNFTSYLISFNLLIQKSKKYLCYLPDKRSQYHRNHWHTWEKTMGAFHSGQSIV